MTRWSYKLYKITETNNDTIPTYHIDNLPKRYNEALLRRINLTLKENKDVMKKTNFYLVQIRSRRRWPALLKETNVIVKTKA